MLLARPICSDQVDDLDLALRRLGVPTAGREYLFEKLPHYQLLLTGLGGEDVQFLRTLSERSVDPGREAFPSFVLGDKGARPGSGLLSGRKEQLFRMLEALEGHAQHAELRRAVLQAIESQTPPAPSSLGGRTFRWGERTYIMGVLNVTPDSFSDGGSFASTSEAVDKGLALVAAGAEVLDVGGESTRPGARPVSVEEELARVLPVLEALRRQSNVPLSIDTTKSQVARAALGAGAQLVNDVSALRFDPQMAQVIAQTGASCCLMHMQGEPRTMQQAPFYEDTLAEVLQTLSEALEAAVHAGVPRERVWVDPGIGFGKTAAHNLFLLRRMRDLRLLGAPVVVGTSRKSFLGALSGGKPPEARLPATLSSLAALAATRGADMVRVHDVAEAREALAVADALARETQGGGAAFLPRGATRTSEPHVH